MAGPISAAWRLANNAPKKRRSGDESLATLHLIRPARELKPRPPAPLAVR